MLIKNVNIVLEDRIIENGYIEFDENIKKYGAGCAEAKDNSTSTAKANANEVFDAQGGYLLPGFVDCHTHGSGGADFMDGTEDDIIQASKSLLRHGTTSYLATTLTTSDEDLFLFLENANKAKNKGGARMLGVHLEGPYINALEKGAQDERYIKKPTLEHVEKVLEKANGLVKRISLAPEMDKDYQVTRYLSKNGILVSGAHTHATYDQISKAYDNGLRELTHFYSGMSSIVRVGGFRVLGCVESGYLIDDLYVEIIADGMHLPPELLDFIFRFKRHDRIVACSDSMRGAGMKDGQSILGPKKHGTDVIIEDGIAKMPDRSCFAGSIATGERLFKTLNNIMKLDLVETAKILALQPAKTIGFDHLVGSIKEGKKADFVLLDKEKAPWKVFLDGKEVQK
jgi:N-acetylglucosamine-6-phosphate deacetylase